MPRRDLYHFEIRTALEKDGWTITHDPLQIVWEEKPLVVVDTDKEIIIQWIRYPNISK